MALSEEEHRRELMRALDEIFADPRPDQEDIPKVVFNIDEVRRRWESHSPEEQALIVTEIDELLLGAEIDEILQDGS